MHTDSSMKMAQRYLAAEEAYQRLTQTMSTELSIPVSVSDNAIYDESDLQRSLIALSLKKLADSNHLNSSERIRLAGIGGSL